MSRDLSDPTATRPLGVALLLALAVASCGDPDARAMSGMPEFCQNVLPSVEAHLAALPTPGGERYGGTAVVGGIGEIPDGMNSLVSADHGANQHQIFMNLMTLLRANGDLELEPYLARDWELNEDLTEVTFHLRDDVVWHDGEPTTAHDVEFTYLRATDPNTGFPNAAFWDHYVGGADGVEVLDEHTIRFRLTPHAELLDPWRSTAILPRHLLGDVPPDELRQHPFGTRCPVGNGPFVFQEHRQDESWSFVRNPGFPEELGGPPYLDRYVYRVIPEQTTLLTELLTETVDVYVAPLPDQTPQIEASEALELRAFPFRNYIFVGWNSRRPQLADPRVRRALTMGTDRAEIVEALFRGYGQVANAGVPPFHWAHHEGIADALPHDPDGAAALLEEAGWVDRNGDGVREDAEGNRLEVSIRFNSDRTRQEIAEIMQAQLSEIGVAVQPEVVEWATLVEQITSADARTFDGVVMGWVTEFKVDDHDLFHSTKSEQPYGWAGIGNDRLDVLLDTLQLVVDRSEALPLWHEYQELLVELQPYTYVAFPRRLAGVNRRLQGVEMDVRGEWVSVADWWIPADRR
ncbi:MAG: ABC transporter substrate-binding protein [Gemmatimonadota bacterium]